MLPLPFKPVLCFTSETANPACPTDPPHHLTKGHQRQCPHWWDDPSQGDTILQTPQHTAWGLLRPVGPAQVLAEVWAEELSWLVNQPCVDGD